MFRLHNKIEKSERRKLVQKRLQFILALGRFVTYTFLSARGVAQLGSATALGAVGRWFESSHPDHFFFLLYPCGGSSIGRASAFQADCCGFESRPPLHKIPFFFHHFPALSIILFIPSYSARSLLIQLIFAVSLVSVLITFKRISCFFCVPPPLFSQTFY